MLDAREDSRGQSFPSHEMLRGTLCGGEYFSLLVSDLPTPAMVGEIIRTLQVAHQALTEAGPLRPEHISRAEP